MQIRIKYFIVVILFSIALLLSGIFYSMNLEQKIERHIKRLNDFEKRIDKTNDTAAYYLKKMHNREAEDHNALISQFPNNIFNRLFYDYENVEYKSVDLE